MAIKKQQSETELLGRKFGRWVVRGFSHRTPKTRHWLCECECGTQRPVLHSSLTSGQSLSCGCLFDGKPRWHKLTSEQVAEVARRYALGESTCALAAAFGVVDATIAKAVRMCGGTIRPVVRKLVPEIEREVASMYEGGSSLGDVARRYHTSQATIRKAIKTHGGRVRTELKDERAFTAHEDTAIAARYASGDSSVQIAESLQVEVSTVISAIRRAGGTIRSIREASHRKYQLNHDYFEEIDTPEKARWWGYIAADGCIVERRKSECGPVASMSLTLCCHPRDAEHLFAFARSLGTDKLPTHYHYDYQDKCWLAIHSTKMCEDLIRHGLGPRKSLTLDPFSGPQHLRRHALAGLMDGDGCVFSTLRESKSSKPNASWHVGLISTPPVMEDWADFLHTEIGVRRRVYPAFNCPKMNVCVITALEECKAATRLFYDDLEGAIPLARKLEASRELWATPRGRCRSLDGDCYSAIRATLTADDVLANFARLGTWEATASHYGYKSNSFVYVRRQLGLEVPPLDHQDYTHITAETLTSLYGIHGTWQAVSKALGIKKVDYIYEIRRRLGVPSRPSPSTRQLELF